MARKPRAVLVALMTGGALAGAAPAADAFDRGYLSVGIFSRGPVKGLALARQTGARKARVTVSTQGLEAGRTYVVGWYTKPCSKPEDAPKASTAIESIELAYEGLSFITRPIALTSSLAKAKSVRIWDKEHVLSCTAARPLNGVAAVFSGPVHGALAVIAAGNEGNAHGYTALPDLDASANNRIALSRKPCTRRHTAADRLASFDFRSQAGGAGEWQDIRLTGFLKHAATAKSARLFSLGPGGKPVQRGCGLVYGADNRQEL